MAKNGPNMTVARIINAKTWMQDEVVVATEAAAQVKADEFRATGKFKTVRVTRFAVGRRPDRTKGERQQYMYAVRTYA